MRKRVAIEMSKFKTIMLEAKVTISDITANGVEFLWMFYLTSSIGS